MSTLGDLIVEHGPYATGEPLPLDLLFTTPGSADRVNALRDELIELRAKAAIYDRPVSGDEVEVTSYGDLGRGERVFLRADGTRRIEKLPQPDDASPEAIAIMDGPNGEALA